MTKRTQIRSPNQTTSLLPLDESTLPYLQELLAEECQEWLTRLLWDYTESSEIIQQVARMGNLPGLIAVDGNDGPIGYCFWIQEGKRVLIGDVYIVPTERDSGAEISLIESMLK